MAEAVKRKEELKADLARIEPLPERQPVPPPPRALEGNPRANSPPAPEAINALRSRVESAGEDKEGGVPPILGVGNQAANRLIVGSWLTGDFLGPDLHRRLAERPPDTLTESPGYFARFEWEMGFRPTGVHLWRTDDIHVSSAIRRRDDIYELMAHEDLHYASELGGGLDLRVGGPAGRPEPVGYVRWFHEGMTELHAQQLARGHGMEPLLVSYPYETAASFCVQRLVCYETGDEARGREILREAYLSGDFTDVSRLVDMALGQGAFRELIGKPDGAQAFRFIRSRLGSAYIGFGGSPDFIRWMGDPLMAEAIEISALPGSLRSALSKAGSRQ
jgi:hypothetical protein